MSILDQYYRHRSPELHKPVFSRLASVTVSRHLLRWGTGIQILDTYLVNGAGSHRIHSLCSYIISFPTRHCCHLEVHQRTEHGIPNTLGTEKRGGILESVSTLDDEVR